MRDAILIQIQDISGVSSLQGTIKWQGDVNFPKFNRLSFIFRKDVS